MTRTELFEKWLLEECPRFRQMPDEAVIQQIFDAGYEKGYIEGHSKGYDAGRDSVDCE